MRAVLRAAVAAWLLGAATLATAGERLHGNLTCVGSDTASALVTRWAAAFQAQHAEAHVQVQAAGSASAPIALTAGAADLGSMSRPMSAAEEAAFSARYGYAPTRIVIAHDAIAVFVHPDNPLARITLAELDAIYSTSRRCGAPRAIGHWRDLADDASAPFGASALLATGRNSGSGTWELFREIALCGGDYRPEVIAWPGNGAVVATVATNPEAIGYAGAGYVNGLVKPLALAPRADAPAVMPDAARIADGSYPLARALYLYVNRPPGRALAPLPNAFVAFALSTQGQALVRLEGFLPLTADERAAQRAALE